jgi:hypothetical protein
MLKIPSRGVAMNVPGPIVAALPAMAESHKLWRIWWLWGIPVAWATAALLLLAEGLRVEGYPRWGDILDLLRLLVYWCWLRLAWRSARNVARPFWTPVAKLALSAGLVLNVLA